MKLYERCLISCALYPEFWMRYVDFVDSKGGREIALDALERATLIFLKVWSITSFLICYLCFFVCPLFFMIFNDKLQPILLYISFPYVSFLFLEFCLRVCSFLSFAMLPDSSVGVQHVFESSTRQCFKLLDSGTMSKFWTRTRQ